MFGFGLQFNPGIKETLQIDLSFKLNMLCIRTQYVVFYKYIRQNPVSQHEVFGIHKPLGSQNKTSDAFPHVKSVIERTIKHQIMIGMF